MSDVLTIRSDQIQNPVFEGHAVSYLNFLWIMVRFRSVLEEGSPVAAVGRCLILPIPTCQAASSASFPNISSRLAG